MSRLLDIALILGNPRVQASILVVDDEPDIGAAVEGVLGHVLGAKVHVAHHGAEALKILEATKIDVVVTDFKMPGMNGVELAKRIRAIHPQMPIVMITAFEAELMDETGVASAADKIIFKPLEARPFIAAVKDALVAAP